MYRYGIYQDEYRTTFVNAATCNENYVPSNPPIAFDVTADMLVQHRLRFEPTIECSDDRASDCDDDVESVSHEEQAD